MEHPYVPHDWAAGTWMLMLLGMVVFVFTISCLFLAMLQRASQTTAPPRGPEPQPSPVPQGRIPTQTTRVDDRELVRS